MNKSLFKNATFNVIYKMLNVLFPLISSMYVSRILMADGVGKVAYAQNIVSYFATLANLGIPTYGVRAIARHGSNQNAINKTFTELMIINSASTTICILIYYFLICSFNIFTEQIKLHMVFGLLIIFNYMNIDWFYAGKEEYQYISVRNTIVKICSIVVLFLFVKSREDYIIYALITCFATGSNYIFNIIYVRKFVKITKKNLNIKQHIKPVIMMFVCFIAIDLYGKIDITMLGSMCSDEICGYYNNAQKVINLVITLVTAISAIFLPRLSYLYTNDKEKFNELTSLGVKIVFFIAIPSCLGIILVSENIVYAFFGSGFEAASYTMKILAILIFLKGIGDVLCYQVIMSSGNEFKFMITFIFAAVLNIILNAILIPRFLQNGAAIASVISELMVECILIPIALHIVKINISRRFIYSVIISSLLMILIVLFVSKININIILKLGIEVFLGIGVYLISNIILKNEILIEFKQKLKIEK